MWSGTIKSVDCARIYTCAYILDRLAVLQKDFVDQCPVDLIDKP